MTIDVANHIDIVLHLEAEVFSAIDHANETLAARGAPFRYKREVEWEQLTDVEVDPYTPPQNETGEVCPSCGSASLKQINSCHRSCRACHWSSKECG